MKGSIGSFPDGGAFLIVALLLVLVTLAATALLTAYTQRKNAAKIMQAEAELSDTAQTTNELRTRVARLIREKNDAFAERNFMVALFARVLLENGLVHPDGWHLSKGWTDDFRGWEGCLYIEPPSSTGMGQMSWHFAESQQWMLDSLQVTDVGKWDGRTRGQKYDAMAAYLRGFSKG